MVSDGAPSENLYGLDIERGVIEISYDLFKDEDCDMGFRGNKKNFGSCMFDTAVWYEILLTAGY